MADDDKNTDDEGTGADQTGNKGNDDQGNPDGYPDGLGDAGKRAIDAMKVERADAKRELAELRSEFDAYKAANPVKNDDNDSGRNGGNDSKEKNVDEGKTVDPADIEKNVRDSLRKEDNARFLRSEVRRLAEGTLNDTSDALLFIDFSDLEPGANGDFDESVIKERLGKLTKDRPYLAAQRFQGGADGGNRGNAPEGQVTREQLKTMTPQQINEARNKGLLKDVLTGK